MNNNDLENMTKSLFFTLTFCVTEAQVYLTQIGEWILSQDWVQALILQALCAYSRAAVAVEKWWAQYYGATFPKNEARWMSVSTVDKATFEFCEVFLRSATDVIDDENTRNAFDCVWLAKMDDTEPYVSARHGATRSFPTGPLEPSKMRFLSMNYRHPDLGEASVSLDVPVCLMVVDNEILSPAFVRRMLPGSTPFDNRYWLECIDNHIAFIKLTASEYIVLSADSWSRVKIVA